MKILLAETNTTPRDFKDNTEQILSAINYGGNASVDLIVTPELSIPGYLVQDLVYQNHFVEKNLECLDEIKNHTKNYPNLNIVVGYVDRNNTGYGKPFKNMAAVIKNGNIIATYAKQLLPFYDVFDEGRYYEPGTDPCVVNINNERWGICICEDVWNDKNEEHYNYSDNPLEKYRKMGITKIISINSSPWVLGKECDRVNMLLESSKARNGKKELDIIYVNQIGGQDELVFDGNTENPMRFNSAIVFFRVAFTFWQVS